MIIGLAGVAGSGKDTAAAVLVQEFGFVRVALADPVKRICQHVFGWSEQRLWGPSEARNAPDPNWGGLTARHALQQVGTECFRALHPDVWVRLCLREAEAALKPRYQDGTGLYLGVVISDVRFPNEAAAIRESGGRVVRIVRPSAGLSGAAALHESESHIATLPCDSELQNDGDLATLRERVRGLL